MVAEDVIARARGLLGVRFRLHGRDPATGLDCVGLVSAALQLNFAVPTGYPLRGGDTRAYVALIDQFASRCAAQPQVGDVLLMSIGPQQHHMGIWAGASLIHAHAGLGRIVETPGALPEALIAAWHPYKD